MDTTGATTETIAVEIGLLDADESAARELLDGVFEDQPRLVAAPIRGPVEAALLIVAGTASLNVLAKRLTLMTCRLRRKGLVMDVRDGSRHFDEFSALPGGVVVTVSDDGIEVRDLCSDDDSTDLADVIRSLVGPGQ